MGAPANSRSHRRRRMMNEINVVPYIDVTLVLLIIFMVTAPMIVTGTIDLPRVGRAAQAPQAAIEITVRQDGGLLVRRNTQGEQDKPVPREQLVATVRGMMPSPDTPVIISAERSARYEHVVEALDALAQAGIARVGLNVRKE